MKRILIFLFLTNIFILVKGQDVNQLIEYYSKGELIKAKEISTKLIDVDSIGAFNQLHGRVLADLGEYHEAIPYLIKAIEIDRNKTDISGWAHGYLGQCYFMLGQYDESKKSLNNCIQLKATRNSVKYANKRYFFFGFNDYFSSWKIIETENIRFHFQYPEKIVNIDSFMAHREKALCKIKSQLGSTLPKKVDFFVWDNKTEPMEKFKINLGFAAPSDVCVYTHNYQTVGHELTHVISYYIGQNSVKTGLINEGLAVYFNMENNDKIESLKTIIKDGEYENIKIVDFWENWQNYSDRISYPLAGAFVQGLIDKYGIEKLKPIFVNQTYETAKKILGVDIDKYIDDFEKEILVL